MPKNGGEGRKMRKIASAGQMIAMVVIQSRRRRGFLTRNTQRRLQRYEVRFGDAETFDTPSSCSQYFRV
jgi:hypothetical protein